MSTTSRKLRFQFHTFLRHDLNASFTVFFVALPICLGVSLASGAPVYSGIVAGILGGIVVSVISKSPLSVSGPAAGLTTICLSAINDMHSLQLFFLSVAVAGLLQILLGVFKLGGFTHFIPTAVIRGMLAAIGIILISKQVPFLIGYNKPDFWRNEFFNILTFNHGFEHITNLYNNLSWGAVLVAIAALGITSIWQQYAGKKLSFLPAVFITVVSGTLVAFLLQQFTPSLALHTDQYVNVPLRIVDEIQFPEWKQFFSSTLIWKYAVMICLVASLETLLSIEAVDKLDPLNRLTPQNRELVAQGTGNILSGFLGGLPITAVIVRSAANVSAGARTNMSAIAHGFWLLLSILFAAKYINWIPYSVLAVILIRTGYNLAKPALFKAVYKQGREQFMPFIITVLAILFTDLLIGVGIGVVYSLYFLVKHTYRAGYTVQERIEGHSKHFTIELAMNVSFLNKKRFVEVLDKIPAYSIVEIVGSDSVYIDHDILEIFHEFRNKAHHKHIQLIMKDIPDIVPAGGH